MEMYFKLFMDGNMFCAVEEGFVNLQESHAGFGKTPTEAFDRLLDALRRYGLYEWTDVEVKE